jgi:hypothetical protein
VINLLAIIGVCLGVSAAEYYTLKHVHTEYCYRILTLGSMGLSLLGVISFVFAYAFHHQGHIFYMTAAIIVGVTPYAGIFFRDMKKTSIPVAITALILRLTMSVLLIFVIFGYFYVRTDPKKRAARNPQP